MSSSPYTSLLPLGPADWVGGDAEDMAASAAAAAVSSYHDVSFDAGECYDHYHPTERQGTLFDALLDFCVSAEAAGGNSEQSRMDASLFVPRPAGGGHAAGDKINNERSSSGASDNGRNDTRSLSAAGGRGSKVAFRTRSDVDVLDDGYRWRKYGKKPVKSSPNPRNYYRCSSEGCRVKKRVERERDDARFVITTYDGVHNHPPAAATPSPPCVVRLGEQRAVEGPSPIARARLAT